MYAHCMLYKNILLCLYIFAYLSVEHKYFVQNNKTIILLCKLYNAFYAKRVCMSMNAYEEIFAANADADASYHDADPNAT